MGRKKKKDEVIGIVPEEIIGIDPAVGQDETESIIIPVPNVVSVEEAINETVDIIEDDVDEIEEPENREDENFDEVGELVDSELEPDTFIIDIDDPFAEETFRFRAKLFEEKYSKNDTVYKDEIAKAELCKKYKQEVE